MNGSPLTSWDGVEAYFTFADSPGAIALFLVLGVAVLVGVVANSAIHETRVFKRFEK